MIHYFLIPRAMPWAVEKLPFQGAAVEKLPFQGAAVEKLPFQGAGCGEIALSGRGLCCMYVCINP